MKKQSTFRETQLALNQHYISQPKPPMLVVNKMPLPFYSTIEVLLNPFKRF